MMKKILSICLIVKNEEERLVRCLDSLKPLMAELDAELIITDTGSTDQTVQVARMYTEQVYFFEWCDDFAAARNAGIDQAKGEWILSIDGDEWLDNPNGIIEFFQSGEYKKYHTAAYKIHNYTDLECSAYTESTAVRLFKKTKERRYQDPIHEYISIKPPLKTLDCFAHHTGYAYATREEEQAKHQRNLAPLLKKSEEEPDDLRNLYHIINQYEAVEDWERALQYEGQAMQAMDQKSDPFFRGAIYKVIAWAKVKTDQWAEAEKTVQEYFTGTQIETSQDMDMWYLSVIIYQEQKKWKQVMESAAQYFRLYGSYADKAGMEPYSLADTTIGGSSAYYMSLIQRVMNALQEDGQCEKLWLFFEQVKMAEMETLDRREQMILLSGFLVCAQSVIVNHEMPFDQRSGLFDHYVDELWNFTQRMYNPALLNSAYLNGLPGMARFSYYAKEAKAFNEMGSGNQTESAAKWMAAAKWNSSMEPFLKEYVEKIDKPIQEKEEQQDEGALSEFERLRRKMRAQIQELTNYTKGQDASQPLKVEETIDSEESTPLSLQQTLNAKMESMVSKNKGSSVKNPLLSIGLIVKNEEKNLARCLDSLQPLMTELNAELIITDTGSTDQTVEIARRYTDQVSFFEWNGDFSAARNDGVDRANGQWFLSIDADEWFEDTSEIILFFKSGEYKKYKAASYHIHNYVDFDKGTFVESVAARMFKRAKNVRYQGAIHEWFPVGEMKELDCFAHHTGYMDTTEETKKVKHQRNLQPLLKELEGNPNSDRTFFHLMNEYASAKEWNAVLSYKQRALDCVRENPKATYRGAIYKVLAGAQIEKHHFIGAVVVIEEYFEGKKEASIIDLDMKYFLILANLQMGAREKAVEAVAEYLDLYDKHQKGNLKGTDSFVSIIMSGTDAYYLDAVKAVIGDLLEAHQNEEVLSVVERLDLAYLKTVRNDRGFWRELLQAAAGSERTDGLTIFAVKILSLKERDEQKETMACFLRCIAELYDRDGYNSVLEMLLAAHRDLPSLLCELYGDFVFGIKLENLNLQFFVLNIFELLLKGKGLKPAQKKQLFPAYARGLRSYAQQLCGSEVWEKDWLKKLPGFEQISCMIEDGSLDLPQDGAIPSLKDMEKLESQGWKKLQEIERDILNPQIPFDQRRELFDEYVEELWNCMEQSYNPVLLNPGYINALPSSARFSYFAKDAKDSHSASTDPQSRIEYLRRLIEVAKWKPVILPFLKECLVQEEQSLNKESSNSPQELSEFEQLGIMVKAQIQQFVAAGKMEEARQILGQYETLNPSDPEIRLLWKTVNGNGLMN